MAAAEAAAIARHTGSRARVERLEPVPVRIAAIEGGTGRCREPTGAAADPGSSACPLSLLDLGAGR
ncbi:MULTISPECIES: hypothetical protein [unclassified Nonomuraea]